MNKLLSFLVFHLFLIGCSSADDKVNKETLKKQQFPLPLSDWIQIVNVRGGQIISPTESYSWFNRKNREVYLNSTGKLITINKNQTPFSLDDLGSVHVEKMHSYQIKRFNNLLNEKFNITVDFKNIYHLRIFSNQPLAYDLFLFSNGMKAKYIYVCIEYCNNTEPDLIIVREKEY